MQATIAAFAASEGHAHPRVVELPKVSIYHKNEKKKKGINAISILTEQAWSIKD